MKLGLDKIRSACYSFIIKISTNIQRPIQIKCRSKAYRPTCKMLFNIGLKFFANISGYNNDKNDSTKSKNLIKPVEILRKQSNEN